MTKKIKNIPREKPKYPALRAIMRDVNLFLESYDKGNLDTEDFEVADFIKRIVEWGTKDD